MRAFDRLATRTRATRHTAQEQVGLDEAEREQWHRREQCGRRKASRMRNVRRLERLQMLGHRARELLDALRRSVCVLVHGFVRRWRRVPIVCRDIDDARLSLPAL